jgi:integrase
MPKLTPISVQNYRPKAKRREVSDGKAGLFLIVQPSGKKSWAIRLRRPNGKPGKLHLGPVNESIIEPKDASEQGAHLTLRQARELAIQYDRKRARGADVIADHFADKRRKYDAAVDRAANTFGAAIREFFIHYKTSAKHGGKRPRRWREDASLLGLKYSLGADPKTTEPEVIPGSLADVWKDRPLADIDKFAVDTVVEEAKRVKPGRARKLFSVLSVLFGQLPLKIRPVNPVLGVKRPGPPASRKRKLDDAEIVIFWKACDKVGGTFGPLFKLLLVTGCRLREASGMRQDELGHVKSPGTLLKEDIWTIPGSRTKNHRTHTLPLPQLALDIIASVPVPPINTSGLVFTHNGKTPVSDFSKTKKLLDVEMAKVAGRPIETFRLHDLRRTFASGLAALGVPLPVTEKLLNHVSGSFGGIVDVYQQYNFDSEKTEALARWAAHLQGLLSDKPSNVAKLRRRKQ